MVKEVLSIKDHPAQDTPKTKEYGLNRELMNSIALFIYRKEHPAEMDPLQLFNEWASACGIRIRHAETLSGIIEHIRKISAVEKRDLEKALKLDNLLM